MLMKRIFWRPMMVMIVLMFSLTVSSEQSNGTQKILLEDVLLFRLQSKNIFLSDLKTYADSLKTLKCLYADSEILKVTQISEDQINRILAMDTSSASEEKQLFERYRRLLSLQIIHNAQEFSVVRDFDQSLPRRQCGVGRFNSWDNELKSLVQAELYMREKQLPMNSSQRAVFLESIESALEFEYYL